MFSTYCPFQQHAASISIIKNNLRTVELGIRIKASCSSFFTDILSAIASSCIYCGFLKQQYNLFTEACLIPWGALWATTKMGICVMFWWLKSPSFSCHAKSYNIILCVRCSKIVLIGQLFYRFRVYFHISVS